MCVTNIGIPGGSAGKESAHHAGDPGSIPGLGRSPLRREWLPTPAFLSEEFGGQRSLAGCSPRGLRVTLRLTHTHTHTRFLGVSPDVSHEGDVLVFRSCYFRQNLDLLWGCELWC